MTQTWPNSDGFPAGSPVFGSKVIGYLGLRPTTTGTLWCGPGYMSDGYGVGLCSVVPKAGDAAAGNDAKGFMRRQVFPAEQRITLTHRKHAVLGGLAAGQFTRCGLFGRVQGGTLTEASPADAQYADVTCYGLEISKLTSTTVRFEIVRYNTGTRTVLATTDGTAASVNNFLVDATIVFKIQASGADVLLTGSVAAGLAPASIGGQTQAVVFTPGGSSNNAILGVPGGSSITGTGTALPGFTTSRPGLGDPMDPPGGGGGGGDPIDFITFTDTSGSKVTGTGRCGFAIDRPVSVSATEKTASVASVFEVADITTPATPVVLWRDQFERAARTLCGVVTDIHGTAGRNLGSDYSTDGASATTSADMLQRDTGSDAAKAVAAAAMGKAVSFDGTTAHHLALATPSASYPGTPAAASTEITVAVWAKIDTNRDGNVLYSSLDNNAQKEGFEFRVEDAGSSNARLLLKIGGASTTLTINSPSFAASQITGQAWCFGFSYKANANTFTGEGRVNWWRGRNGQAELLGTTATIPSSRRPLWQLTSQHYIGRDIIGGGTTSADLMDGIVDHASVFYADLDAADMDIVCNQLNDVDDLIVLGLAHQLDFETQIAGTPNKYRPSYPLSVSDANSWAASGSPEPSWVTGIKPTGAVQVHWSQRPPTNPSDQARSIKANFDAQFSVVGLILRGTPSTTPSVYSGYRLDVAPGTPAAIDLFRVIGGVATKMARQPLDGLINVSQGILTQIELSVEQVPGGGPTGSVSIAAEVGGTPVVFEKVAAGGALIDTTGAVIDADDARILSGLVEGFITLVDTNATVLDDWEEGVVSPPAPDPSGFPNIAALTQEDDAVAGALEDILDPDWTITPTQVSMRTQVDFDSGHSQRYALGTYARRRFRMSKLMDPDSTELADLHDFWEDHKGPEIGFTWDPSTAFPGIGSEGTFAFLGNSLRTERAGRLQTVSFEIEERRSAT